MTIANVVTIAGSDPSGGAGIQADLKTFAAHGVYGASVITALTAQNTTGVQAVHVPPASFLAQQLTSVFDDLTIGAVKVGMLAGAEVVAAVVDAVRCYHPRWLVVDPVMVATSGDRLLLAAAETALRDTLLPLASLVTPNLPEAAVLLNRSEDTIAANPEQAAVDLAALGPQMVYLKGGHGQGATCVDVFWTGTETIHLSAPRVDTANTHGTGCTLAASLAARLARGETPVVAARGAHAWLHDAIANADLLNVGNGHGPVYHGFQPG